MGLRRRRHLRLQGRKVTDVSDEILDGSAPLPGDVVGDGPLAAALDRARTGRMREAVSTLQAEQDAIVRSPHRGITVVDGGPGTGKTLVALHRAAYVLYAFPSLAERGVLVYGPNRRFLDYISDVLPSLGENDVRLATLGRPGEPALWTSRRRTRSTSPPGSGTVSRGACRSTSRATCFPPRRSTPPAATPCGPASPTTRPAPSSRNTWSTTW